MSGQSFDQDRQDKYIPPKKPYSLEAMLDDILEFAALTLIDHARLSLWMPTANDEEIELGAPIHHCLDVVSVCVQPFNKCKLHWGPRGHQITRKYSRIPCPGSRRLLTYQRIPDHEIKDRSRPKVRIAAEGSKADDLNAFRKRAGAPRVLFAKPCNGADRPHSIFKVSKRKESPKKVCKGSSNPWLSHHIGAPQSQELLQNGSLRHAPILFPCVDRMRSLELLQITPFPLCSNPIVQ